MSLILYRRHTLACAQTRAGANADRSQLARVRNDRSFRRCKCPIWAEGTLARAGYVRRTTKETRWEKAEEFKRRAEDAGSWGDTEDQESEEGPVTLEQAIAAYSADQRAQSLAPSTLRKYTHLFRQLRTFAEERGLRFAAQLDTQTLREFRGTWADQPLSATKKLERLRSFIRFCHSARWLAENTAHRSLLRSPKVVDNPTLPYTRDQMVAILGAFERLGLSGRPGSDEDARRRLQVLVYVMRYAGLAIADAVSLSADKLTPAGDLQLHRAKSGENVFVPLPGFLIEELRALPLFENRYFFWNRKHMHSKLETATGNARRALRRVFQLAGIQNGHPHRFRDTFAVEHLNAGTPIEDVAAMLGHASIRVTEKSYLPWVQSRQQRLRENVLRSLELEFMKPAASGLPQNAPQPEAASTNGYAPAA